MSTSTSICTQYVHSNYTKTEQMYVLSSDIDGHTQYGLGSVPSLHVHVPRKRTTRYIQQIVRTGIGFLHVGE